MKNKKQKQKKKMSINIYTIYNNGSFEKIKIKISLLLKFLRNIFGHLRNLHCQTLMYLGQ